MGQSMNSVHDFANSLKEQADSIITDSVNKLKNRKRVLHNDNHEVSQKLKDAVSNIAKAVTVTLGPKGQNVLFEINGIPIATKDGVTVTKQLLPVEDPIENMAIQLVIQAAETTADLAGDGTTTTVAFTDALVRQLVDDTTNSSPKLKKELEEALAYALTSIKKKTKKIHKKFGIKAIENIAYTSGNNSYEIASKIKKIYQTLTDWNTEVNFMTTPETHDRIELLEGYKFEHRSPSCKDKKIVVDNPYIVLCNFKVTDWNNLLKNAVINYGHDNTPVVFVVRDYVQEMPALLKEHSDTYRVPMYMVRIDTFGNQMDRQFEDLSLNEPDFILKNLPRDIKRGDTPYYYMKAKQAVFTPEASYIMYEDDDREYQKNQMIPNLEVLYKEFTDEVEKKNIQDRIKKLRGVTCNYYVGGITAAETNEKFYRIEDAILAVRSAILYGTINGGGIVYHQVAEEILNNELLNKKPGAVYLANALKEPLRIMCRTSDIDFADVEKSLRNTNYSMYFDFAEDKYQEVSKSMIYDSAKTATTSIENAVSIATTIMTTNSIIYIP